MDGKPIGQAESIWTIWSCRPSAKLEGICRRSPLKGCVRVRVLTVKT